RTPATPSIPSMILRRTVVAWSTVSCFGLTCRLVHAGGRCVPMLTQVFASEFPEPPFVELTVAVLSTTPVFGHLPPLAAVVGEMTWTVNVLAASVVPARTD